MRRAFLAIAFAAAVLVGSPSLGHAQVTKDVAATPAGKYDLDPAHTSVTWRVRHLGISNYTARFDKISGSLTIDPKAPEASMLTVSIDPKSVSTGLPAFDAKLAKDAFGADAHPAITFVSGKVNQTGPDTAFVTGNLTLKGVTKPVTLEVTWNGGLFSKFAQGHVIGFSAKGALKRSDFGVTNWAGAVGDDVELLIEAEFQNRGTP